MKNSQRFLKKSLIFYVCVIKKCSSSRTTMGVGAFESFEVVEHSRYLRWLCGTSRKFFAALWSKDFTKRKRIFSAWNRIFDVISRWHSDVMRPLKTFLEVIRSHLRYLECSPTSKLSNAPTPMVVRHHTPFLMKQTWKNSDFSKIGSKFLSSWSKILKKWLFLGDRVTSCDL